MVIYCSISVLSYLFQFCYRNAEDRARYPNHMIYPMSPEIGETTASASMHGLYPSGGGGGTGWGDGHTSTGGGTGHSGYG